MGGGFKNLKAIELNTICKNPNTDCEIKTPQPEITNSIDYKGYEIKIQAQVGSFINYGKISLSNNPQQQFNIEKNGSINHFINYGTFGNLDKMGIWVGDKDNSNLDRVTNYGIMGSVDTKSIGTITLNNLGLMGGNNHHIEAENGKVLIENFMVKVTETASTFNNFSKLENKYTNFSHLVINIKSSGSITFKDNDSKIILDFGSGFEFGEKYLISKVAVNENNNGGSPALGVDFSRLMPRSDIFYLTQSGDYFIATLNTEASTIGNLYKSNIRTMNNFTIMSNAMIYPRKVYHSQNLGRKNPSLRDSANHLKSYESFAYRNKAVNRRIQRQNKRNYSRESLKSQKLQNQKQSQNLTIDSANRTRESQNQTQNPHDYYFILTPFINHNYFFEQGRYNLSGFDYGFLTAFSARVAESNSLGAHFMMSYGSLGDKKDKDFMIKSLNLNVGLNYKLDLMWDMFIKARGDFFYFLNQAKTLTMFGAIKPNNLGFGASVSYGKEWDFKSGGVLGIEAGLDYKALQSSTISLHDNIYQKQLYHLIYADLGVSYSKYFGNFGLNAGLGIKGNITANKLAKSQIRISALDKSVDMMLDNDNFLGYANLGASYVLNTKSFDMEFSLAYYGSFGDRAISNAGGFEWRVFW